MGLETPLQVLISSVAIIAHLYGLTGCEKEIFCGACLLNHSFKIAPHNALHSPSINY